MQLFSLDGFCCCAEGTDPTRWIVHLLQNSNGKREVSTYHYITPGGSFGKPLLTSFHLGLPFCKMWIMGFPTAGVQLWLSVFKTLFSPTCGKLCNCVKCFIILFLMLHPAPIHHRLIWWWWRNPVKEPLQALWEPSAMSLEGTWFSSFASAPCTMIPLPQLDLPCCLSTVWCV